MDHSNKLTFPGWVHVQTDSTEERPSPLRRSAQKKGRAGLLKGGARLKYEPVSEPQTDSEERASEIVAGCRLTLPGFVHGQTDIWA